MLRSQDPDLDDRGAGATASEGARDLALVRAAQEGDPTALRRLAERFRVIARILTALNRREGAPLSDEDLEDLVQDVAIAIWQRLDRFEGRGPLEAWFYRFCALQFRNRTRRETRRREILVFEDEVDEPTEADPALQADGQSLHTALDGLDSGEGKVIRLRHFDSLTFAQIGSQLGISTGTAKSRYYRGLQQLRQRLASWARGGRT